MSNPKISEIKGKLASDPSQLSRQELEWLVKRVEELEKENDWLKRELSYAEHQGEVSF
ncbi:MAG: hypothetical protein AB1491_00530 [Thermodesulfobacteriota bacterium]